MIVQKQICDQLISETEEILQRMGLDLYEIMQRAPAVVEKWKRYYGPFLEVWNHASSREELTAFLLTGPDPSPEEMETVLTLIRRVPYLLRRSLQDAAKSLPPPPGGRPRELGPEHFVQFRPRKKCKNLKHVLLFAVLESKDFRIASRTGAGIAPFTARE
jgi:hypothetical protein